MTRSTWRDENLRAPESTQQGDAKSHGSTEGTLRTDRGTGPAPTVRDLEQRSVTQEGSRSILHLPSSLAAHWRIERELESRGAEADLLIVNNFVGERRVAKIYRAGIHPKTEVLQRLGGASFEHVVRLFDHGHSDGRWYELLEYVEGGSLEDLIRREGPKFDDMRVGQVLVELLKAIQHLHANNVVHRDIKPSNVLVRSLKPFDLILTDFGIASVLGDGSRRFTTGNRTIAYAAPEAAVGEVSKASDWWSLGIMLLEILTGRHPFAGGRPGELIDDRAIMSRLAQMPVDHLVEGIAEPWRVLCRGLLRREAKNRWTDAEIVRWVRRDPGLVVTDEVPPTSHDHAPFFFAGARYSGLSEIARAFGANWGEARKTIERGHFLNWVKDDLKDNEWRQYLSDLDRDCSDLDERVFRVIVKLDPAATPIFCGYKLDPSGLHALADDASSNKNEAKSILQSIIDRSILEIAGKSSGVSQFKKLHDSLTLLLADYRKFCDAATRAGAPASVIPADRDLPRASMLRSVLPDGEQYVASLRQNADKIASRDARECPWFRELADASANSTAALLVLPLVASAAGDQTKERRRRDELAERQRHYDEAYNGYSFASGFSTGALGGLAVGFIPCWIFTGVVTWFGGVDVGWKWFSFLMFGFTVVGIVIGCKIAFEKQWVRSQNRDAAETRNTGLSITIPSLAITGLLVLYWTTLSRTDTTYARANEEQRQIQSRAQAQAQERQRLFGLVNYAVIARDIVNDQLVDENPALTGPTTMVVYYKYGNNVHTGDNVTTTLNGNVAASGFTAVNSACQPFKLNFGGGSAWCRWTNIYPGTYNVLIHVNGLLVKQLAANVSR